MELLQLRYFCVIAQCQNLTQAAEKLRVSQPALSKTLKSIETQLGVPLFDRVGRHIRLNAVGEMFYRKAAESLRVLDEGIQGLTQFQGMPSGKVELLVQAASTFFAEFYLSFYQKYPLIKLLLQNYVQQGNMSSEDYDFRIFATYSYSPHKGSIALATEPMVLAVPEHLPLASRPVVDLIEAADYPFVASDNLLFLEDVCRMAGFRPNVVMQCDNGNNFQTVLRAGIGCTILPKYTLVNYLPENIRTIPFSNPKITRTVVLSWSTNRKMTPAAALFLEELLCYVRHAQQQWGVPEPPNSGRPLSGA